MIGTAVVSLPWAFQQSGLALGSIIAFVSYLISFYTCQLIVMTQGDDADFSDTLKKYFGNKGYYAGILSPILLITGAVTVLFVIMSQLTYPIFLAIYAWTTGNHPKPITTPDLTQFSSSYTAIILFFLTVAICSKKDLAIFVKMGSFGAFAIMTLLVFIIAVGVIGLQSTTYEFGPNSENIATDWLDITAPRTLTLFNKNFSPIAGILCAGYFLHTCSVPIMRSAEKPENNMRDLFISYTMVFLSYLFVGAFGYIGFMGIDFRNFFYNERDKKIAGQIDQNCLNMFDYTNIPAFILRIAICFILFSTYPLISHFLKNLLKNLFWRKAELSSTTEFMLTLSLSVIPLLCALFYPNVGTLLSYVGALSGFVIIYLLPVMVYLKMRKLQILNPLLAEAIARNEFKVETKDPALTPKLVVSDRLARRGLSNPRVENYTRA